ncbi:MAG: MFS transporter [Pseudomonadota bacterium]
MAPTLAFSLIFFLVALGRTLLLTALPLEAFARLGSAEYVSYLFLLASAGGICVSLNLPVLLKRLGCRGVFYVAASLLVLATQLLQVDSVAVFLLGMLAYLAANTAFEITLSVYVMRIVPRDELARFEPQRVLAMVFAFTIGPWFGVFAADRWGSAAPFVLTSVLALTAVIYFRLLGLHRVMSASADDAASDNPLRNVRRFVAQPRLRLAWLVAFLRSTWWNTLFVYGPILVVSAGLDKVTAGSIVSLSVAMAFAVPLWARLGRRIGLRRLLTIGFGATAFMSLVLASVSVSPLMLAGLMVLAAASASMIDGAGNIAFLRAVRGAERSEMASVFGTFRDAAQLGTPLLGSLVLLAAPLTTVFGVIGVGMFGQAWLCRYLPRRM